MSKNNSSQGKYDKFKTPVVEISIGTVGGALKKLPEQIMKLVEKVEVTLTQEKESCILPQITVTFIEGSREPYSPSGGFAFVYGSEIQGLNNKTGLLTDLTIDSSGSLIVPTSTAGTIPIEPKIPNQNKYLFQEGNIIEVKIFYAESPELTLRVRGYISVLESDFPSDDQPRTKITALGPSAELDKISPPVAVVFKKIDVLSTKISPQNAKESFTYTSKNIYEILSETCKEKGLGLVISGDLLAVFQDPDKHFVWPAGKSFIQFLNDLASRANAYFGVAIDPLTDTDTVFFVSKAKYNSQISITDRQLFTYRAPGSLLKDVSVKVDFSAATSVYHAGWNEKGNEVKSGYEEHGKQLVAISNAGAVNTLPKGKGAEAIVKNLKESKSIGKVNAVPYNDKKIASETAISSTACAHNKTVALEFTSLGYPPLKTGKINIEGIGERYSNCYTVINVTHTIDSSGYSCKAVCTNDNIASGGAVSDKKQIIKLPSDDDKDKVNLPINVTVNFLQTIEPTSNKSLVDVIKENVDINLAGIIPDLNPKETIDKFYT